MARSWSRASDSASCPTPFSVGSLVVGSQSKVRLCEACPGQYDSSGQGRSQPHEPTVATSQVRIGNSGLFSRSETHNLQSTSPDGPLAPTGLREFSMVFQEERSGDSQVRLGAWDCVGREFSLARLLAPDCRKHNLRSLKTPRGKYEA